MTTTCSPTFTPSSTTHSGPTRVPIRTVRTCTVRMGPRVGPLWVVEEGVKPGEHVVVKGLQQIRAGMRVEPILEMLPPTPGS